MPASINWFMMSSLVEITSDIGTFISLTSFSALLFHTFVPCERPLILTKSENVFGLVSLSMPLTKFVPNSGMAIVPTPNFKSSLLIPKASVDEKSDKTFSSSNGISSILVLVKSSRFLIMFGTSWPSRSSLSILPLIEW